MTNISIKFVNVPVGSITNYFTNVEISINAITNTNWSGFDFSGANLANLNLTNYNFAGANLMNANLMNANLSGADLMNANLSGADLNDVTIAGIQLSNTKGLSGSGLEVSSYFYQDIDLLAVSDSGVTNNDNHTSNENLSFAIVIKQTISDGTSTVTNYGAPLLAAEILHFQFSNTVSSNVTNYRATVNSGNYDISGVAEANYDPFAVSLFISNTGDDSVTTLVGSPLTVWVDRTIGDTLSDNLDTSFFTMVDVFRPGTQTQGIGGFTFINTNGNTIMAGDTIGFNVYFREPINIAVNPASAFSAHTNNIIGLSSAVAWTNYQFFEENRRLRVFFEVTSGFVIGSITIAGIFTDNSGNSFTWDGDSGSSVDNFLISLIVPSGITYP